VEGIFAQNFKLLSDAISCSVFPVVLRYDLAGNKVVLKSLVTCEVKKAVNMAKEGTDLNIEYWLPIQNRRTNL
jgi:hypothetical protein